MSILVLGTVALDTVKTPFGKRRQMLGGSAVHFSMSARLFTQVHLVAIIGNDFPRQHIRFLKQKGLVLDSLITGNDQTFQWEGEYQGDLNTALTLKTQLGVLLNFRPVITPAQRNIKNIFLANVDPDIQRHLLRSLRAPRLKALDSMNFWITHKRKSLVRLLPQIDIYVANDQEARLLSAEHNLIKAAQRLRSWGPKMVLIKKGEHGVLFYSDEYIVALPAFPIATVIDPTGAGDTFAGGFMGYLSTARRITRAVIKQALAYGTVCASLNVEGFGVARTSAMTRNDVARRLAQFKRCAAL